MLLIDRMRSLFTGYERRLQRMARRDLRLTGADVAALFSVLAEGSAPVPEPPSGSEVTIRALLDGMATTECPR